MNNRNTRKFIWVITWLIANYLCSTFIHSLVFLFGAYARGGVGANEDFFQYLLAAFSSSWSLGMRGYWQGNSAFIFSLLIAYGVLAGLWRHKGYVKLIPIALLIAMVPAYLLFIPILLHQFQFFFSAQVIVLIGCLTLSGLGIDKLLERWFHLWLAKPVVARDMSRYRIGW